MLYEGDCLDIMLTLEANSVDSIVTDPPAGISFMGKEWDKNKGGRDNWIKWMEEIAIECLRVIKPGGHALVWSIPRTSHWTATAWENAGWEPRDKIYHCFGTGFPKSLDISKNLDSFAKKRWFDINKGIDNLDKGAILELWKRDLNNVKFVEQLFPKNIIETGMSIEKNDFVQENVLLKINIKKYYVDAIIAELNFIDQNHIQQEKNQYIVQENAEVNIKQLQNNVKFAVKLLPNLYQILLKANIFTVEYNVQDLLNENTIIQKKVEKHLKTIYGEPQLLNNQTILVLCAEIIEDLKFIILNLSPYFQNLDMTSQMECVSATDVIITEYMMENLILNMVNILKNNALIKSKGAERKIVGKITEGRAATPRQDIRGGKFHACSEGDTRGYDGSNITAPSTEEAKQWDGWGTALKPAVEEWWLFRKPLRGTVVENVLEHGIGGLNIDGCRVETAPDDIPGWHKSGAKGSDGYMNTDTFKIRNMTAEEIQERCGGKGRWPANLIHDGSNEVVGLFPNTGKSAGGKSGHTAAYCGGYKEEYYGDLKPGYGDNGSAARFFYCAKASREEREAGCENLPGRKMDESRKEGNPGGDNPRNRGVTEYKNHHPTVKSLELMRYLCKLITPPKGIVLDPFMGSGTTGIACKLEGFDFIGIDLDPENVSIAEARINHWEHVMEKKKKKKIKNKKEVENPFLKG